MTKSWERELPYLMTYLSYPEELRPSIYTTNILERFIKEVKRRTKVIEVFPHPDATGKVMYRVASEMNEAIKGDCSEIGIELTRGYSPSGWLNMGIGQRSMPSVLHKIVDTMYIQPTNHHKVNQKIKRRK